MKIVDVRDDAIYSSVILGDGAIGKIAMFTIPLGQPVARLGSVPDTLGVSSSRIHTNMYKCCTLGASFGDFAARSIELHLVGGMLADAQEITDHTTLDLRVCDQRVCSGLLGGITSAFNIPIHISQNDTLIGRLTTERPLRLSQPVLVSIMLRGTSRREVR